MNLCSWRKRSMRPVEPNCAVNGGPGIELPFDSGERLRLADGMAVLLVSGAAGPGSQGRRRETSLWLGDRWTPSPHGW